MNKEEQRIIIAKACGWTGFNQDNIPDCLQYTARRPNGKWDLIPDYLNDLNAMHDAEEMLCWTNDRPHKTREYAMKLYEIIDSEISHELGMEVLDPVEVSAVLLRATAKQRAEAFLKTLDLWKRSIINQGWRYFHCEDCEYRWKQSTRDWKSPSGENCPRCGEWWFPYHGEADDLLRINSHGNLIENKMEFQTYIPETREIDKSLLYNTISALEAGLEYTQELLIKHDTELGRTTRSNKFVAEQMESEIQKMKKCLDKLKEISYYNKNYARTID